MSRPQWCRNRTHILPDTRHHGRCGACVIQNNRRQEAKRSGRPFCDAGHGLVSANVAEDGSCAECARYEALAVQHIPPVPETWLDWAAVSQALLGKPLVRPLSQRELVCLFATLKSRHVEWSRRDIAEWLADNTELPTLTAVYMQHLELIWWRKRDLPDPRITIEQAIFAEVDGDIWAANYRQARDAAAKAAAARQQAA